MSSLLALKNRKKVIDTIYRTSSAMKAVASMRVRKMEQLLENFQVPKNIIANLSSYFLESIFLKNVMNKNSNVKADILIGCDSGMCGDFVNMIKNYFIYKSKEKKNSLWLLFGSKFEFLVHADKVFYIGKIEIDSAKIIESAAKIYTFIQEHNVTELTIHYATKNGIESMSILSKLLIEQALIQNDNFENDIFIQNKINLNEISQEYGYFYLASKLYQVFLENMYEENRQRIIAMTQAKTNAQDMGKIIDRLYNRARQEKITIELNEIASSMIE